MGSPTPAASLSFMNRALVDYFRCPETFADFALRGELCPGEGYFRFGQDLICYGQSSLGYYAESSAQATCDLSYHTYMEGNICYIPFDPSAVVDSLRREHYVGSTPSNGKHKRPIHDAYYWIRPHLGVPVRKYLQRWWLKRRDRKAFPQWPVDRTVDQLLEKLLALSMKVHGIERIPFIWFWPDGQKSCAIVTHDVEESAGVEFCPALMDIDDSFGIKSSFQFIPENRYEVPSALLHRTRERGFEVNVHDLNHDGRLYDDWQEFLRRAAKINRYVKEFGASGFRAGVLYRRPDWYEAFDFSYDMSIPNVGYLEAQPGGCCTVMPYFIGKVLELPLTTAQDYTLFHILSDYSIALWRQQITSVTRNHGLLNFNTHPDYLLEQRARETYTDLLALLSRLRSQGKIWLTLPKEVDRWWRERAKMNLVCEDGHWRVEGQGSERARLAYASRDGDGISYTFDLSAEKAP
jgi:hypothetical protein